MIMGTSQSKDILKEEALHEESFIEPFKAKKEISKYIRENQSYYKKSIPEVDEYFAKKYGLK